MDDDNILHIKRLDLAQDFRLCQPNFSFLLGWAVLSHHASNDKAFYVK